MKGQGQVPQAEDTALETSPIKKIFTPDKLPKHVKGWIKEWWYSRGEYSYIQEKLATEGYFVPKDVLTVWSDRKWPDAIPGIDEFNPDFLAQAPSRQALQLLWAKAVQVVRGLDPGGMSGITNISTMSGAINRLASTESLLDRLEADKLKAGGNQQKVLEAAKEQLMAEARRVLEQRPELLEHVNQICQVIEVAEDNLNLIN